MSAVLRIFVGLKYGLLAEPGTFHLQTWCLLSNAPPEMMSLLTPRGSMRRSTFCEEDLGEVVDLCGHGTWANADLCEIIQELVDALSPLQTMSKGHEERFVALEAVQKTAQEQASGETRWTTEQTREFTEPLFENASQESGHQVPESSERLFCSGPRPT